MFHWGGGGGGGGREIVCRPLQENGSKHEKPQIGAFWLEDASHVWCEYSMQEVCKISRGGKRKKKEGRGKEKEKRRKKGKGRTDEGRRKKEEERTAALVMEASLTGLGGQSLACCHLQSAS